MIKELPAEAYLIDSNGIMTPAPGWEEIVKTGDLNAMSDEAKARFNSFTDEKIDEVLNNEEDEYDPEAGDITL